MELDALASYVGDMLRQAAKEELGMLLGITGEIDQMGEKLQDLQNFLADGDRRNIADQSIPRVGSMYEATDILDLCQLKAMEHGSSSIDAGCLNPLLFCLRNPFHAHEIDTRIKELYKRLDTIKERSTIFHFINLGSYEDRHSRKIEEDTRTFVAQITQRGDVVNNNIMVVAIVGAGGIGKTILAQKVFNDEASNGNFSKKIWLSVNKNFSEAELLKRAIIEVRGDHQPAGDAMVALHRTLKEVLIGHTTLLVMDDVWDLKHVMVF